MTSKNPSAPIEDDKVMAGKAVTGAQAGKGTDTRRVQDALEDDEVREALKTLRSDDTRRTGQ